MIIYTPQSSHVTLLDRVFRARAEHIAIWYAILIFGFPRSGERHVMNSRIFRYPKEAKRCPVGM